ncbi:MAG TPA: AI-2E family transporter [Methylomirabilota bacterium]|nr:AI-2E family transporter [Methylomirabilota bacterium]
MSTPPLRPKLERNLGWIVLAILLVGGLLVLRPFASALLWAAVLCFSSWPLYQRLLNLLRGRRTWAALIMALGMILIILLPFVVIGLSLADNVKDLTAAARKFVEAGPPAPPDWLAKIPAVGEKATEYWRSLATDNAKLVAAAKRLLELVSGSLLIASLAITRGLLELALSIFIAFFLFRDGVAVAARLSKAVERIGGERGTHLLEVAGKTVRGVVYGILGTALVQALMAGVGFAIAGVPGAALLALLTFFLSVVPMGPPLVWIPAALWLFNQGSTGWGIFMIVWGVAVSSIDNVVKPWLISQGSNMPFLLIFFGVLGGALAFGFIGVFIGPTLLAVGYRLVEGWAANKVAEATLDVSVPGETKV